MNICEDFCCGVAEIEPNMGSISAGGQLAKVICTDKCIDALHIVDLLREMDMANREVWYALFSLLTALTKCNNQHRLYCNS